MGGEHVFEQCVFEQCEASETSSGGAIRVEEGRVELREKTQLFNNYAPGPIGEAGTRNSIYVALGDAAGATSPLLEYHLPAPLGYYIESALDPNTPPGVFRLSYNSKCDSGSGCTYADFPNGCLPGLAGDSEATEHQYSLACNGLCPPGKLCTGATAEPAPCGTFSEETGLYTAGGYCPEGSFQARFCPAGTFGTATDLEDASECTACQPGTFCGIGSTEETPCPPGTYAGSPNAGACTPCEQGTYMPGSEVDRLIALNGTGATACIDCGAGFYCVCGTRAPTPDTSTADRACGSRVPFPSQWCSR